MKKLILPLFLVLFLQWSNAQTAGTLTVTTTTSSPGANTGYDPENVLAIWVQNSAGVLVNTLLYNTRNSNSSAVDLTTWYGIIGSHWSTTAATLATYTKTNTDAVTGATNTSYGAKTCYWGKNVDISAVSDGVYTVKMELLCNNVSVGSTGHKIVAYTFTKGAAISTGALSGSAQSCFSNVSVQWIPTYLPDTQVPTTPTGLMNTTPSKTSFTLLWTASDDNVGVVGYDVYKNGVFYASTSTTSLSITGLNPETAYTMTVKAKDAIGNVSSLSSPLVVTTDYYDSYNITLQQGDGGSVIENNVVLGNGWLISANRGTTKTFTFVPNTGYEIATLTYNNINVKSQVTNNQFTTPAVTAIATLSVTFKKIQYIFSIKSAEGGIVNQFFEYGLTPSFSFAPYTGWRLNTVFYNSTDVTNLLVNGVYTVPEITANAFLNVSFVSIGTDAPELINNSLKVYCTNSALIVDGASKGETVRVFTIAGKQIKTVISTGERINIPVDRDTVYLLKTGGKTFKLIL